MSSIAGTIPAGGEFSAQVNSTFTARLDDGPEFSVCLVNVDVRQSDDQVDNFSLEFRVPVEMPQAQAIFHLEHPELAEMDLFMVPVRQDADGLYFEAIINRFLN